ncbi:MAG: MbnP family protein [Bacteroidota bacterium]
MIAMTVSGCEKEDHSGHSDSTGHVDFTVTNKVDNEILQIGQRNYTTADGDSFQIDLLKYFITNFTFVKADGSEHNVGNYDLINSNNPASYDISLNGIPFGTYTGLRFYLGIDSARNNDLTNIGDLDPSTGMFWPWNTGYIFFMAEGSFVGSTGTETPLRHHYGGTSALVSIDLPMDITISSGHRHVDLAFNINALYNTPTPIDLDVDYDRQSFASDRTWLESMKGNFPGAFSITGIH